MLSPGKIRGKEILDLSRDLHSMYTYCDLVEPQVVDDIAAPLLRAMPQACMHDTLEAMNKVFNHIYFPPVLKNDIQTIKTDIRDVFKRSSSVGFQLVK